MLQTMWVIFALVIYVAYSDETLSLKLCNKWEVGSEVSMETYLKQFHLTSIGKYIIQNRKNVTDKNSNWYLPQLLIDYHLSKFKLDGASFIGSSNMLYSSNYGHSSPYIGNNQQIVTTYPEMHHSLMNCSTISDPKQCMLDYLDINEADSPFINNEQIMLYKINETYMDVLNLRMISVNNTKNIGGYTMKGLSEAMIDHTKWPMFCYEPITDVNGSFCYPFCKEIICGQNKNCFDSYCPHYNVTTTSDKYKFYFDFINDNNYCVPSSNIININDIPNNKCDDNSDDNMMDKLFNYGTLLGVGMCLIIVFIIWGIIRASGVKCTKTRHTFISDQLLRDDDQYLL